MSAIEAKHSITLKGALRLVNETLRGAEEMKLSVAVAVVDESCHIKALARMDGTTIFASQIAINKARTAAGFKTDTKRLWEVLVAEPSVLAGLPNLPGVAAYGGGVALIAAGECVGAIGVSGASSADDLVLAEHAAASLAVEFEAIEVKPEEKS
jgi:uncharacterized protein GlcG (DUF336 family)